MKILVYFLYSLVECGLQSSFNDDFIREDFDDPIRNGLVAEGQNFTLDGKEIRILSGSIHYFRVPRNYWRDRIIKLRQLGFNTVQTYVAWNFHEPAEGEHNFDGDADLETFLEIASEEQMYVILRPGPYICAEWEWGGYPAWLLNKGPMELRTTHSQVYLDVVQKWFNTLLPKIKRFQYTLGGNIIAFQVENEYGSYHTQDHKYLPWLQTQMKNNGLVELFFTSDGGSQLKPENLLEGVLHTVNFQEVGNNLEKLKTIQPNKPMMVTEFWSGWFDHWGQEKHSTTTLKDYEKNIRQILDAGASINLYMFTGGTSFGFMSGSNHHVPSGLPLNDVTSYDYDAPLTEHGNWTAKYNLTQKIIQEYFPFENDDSFAVPITKDYGDENVDSMMSVFESLAYQAISYPPFLVESPIYYEKFVNHGTNALAYGYALYSTLVPSDHANFETLNTLSNIQNAFKPNQTRARFYLDQIPIATIDLQSPIQDDIQFSIDDCRLDILTENSGRINFSVLDGNHVGIGETLYLNDKVLNVWNIQPLPMEPEFISRITKHMKKSKKLLVRTSESQTYPMFFHATLKLKPNTSGVYADTFVDVISNGFEKGVIFVNGLNLGRYWNKGPQKRLYLPSQWLHVGTNHIVIFEEKKAGSKISFKSKPDLGPV